MLFSERLRRISRRNRPSRRNRVVVLALLIVVAVTTTVVACTGGGGSKDDASDAPQLSLPPPSYDDIPVVTLPDGFVQPDTRGVRISPVVAQPKGGVPALPVYGGSGSIRGVVNGPDGPVAGATVKLERWVGGRSGTINVNAGGDGRFSTAKLLGGRYRVRAWLQPNLTATESQVLFLAIDGSSDVTVDVSKFEGLQLQAGLDVSVINVDDTAHVRALFTRAAVDDDGIVTGDPVPAAKVQLTSPQGLSVTGDNPATTGDGGLATWTVKCDKEGSYTVTLTTEGATTTYTLPTCGPKPTPTTTPTPTPDIPVFNVGDEFTVPRTAPLPPGTYVTFVKGCSTTFEAFTNGVWETQRREIKGDLSFVVPVRDLKPSDGTDGCSYLRTA